MSLMKRVDSIRKNSISRTLYIGLILIVSLLIGLAFDTQNRLNTFYDTLEKLSEDSLVTVIDSVQVSTQINNLSSISELLLTADSDPLRRVGYSQVNEQLELLFELAEKQTSNDFTILQLETITRELSKLNQLVRERLKVNDALNGQLNRFFSLHSELTSLSNGTGKNVTEWQRLVDNVVVNIGKLFIVEQLYLFEDLSRSQGELFEQLEHYIQQPKVELTRAEKDGIKEFIDVVANPQTGIYAVKKEQLKITGRARGRANMVRNLIKDYARLSEFESYQLNSEILENARLSNTAIKNQIKTIKFVFAVSIVVIIIFSVFISRYVVGRLLSLKYQVRQRSEGKNLTIKVSGTDEVTELAQTFDSFATTIEQQKQALSEMSRVDPLTGTANRRVLDERIDQELNIAIRQRWPISILVLDLDFFKQYNDNYGHTQGDICLKQTAKLLQTHAVRKTDLLARFGGEEFVILLPNTTREGAINLAELILKSFEVENIPHLHSKVADYLTVSIGIYTEYNVQLGAFNNLFENADRALYKAKQNGRNRWEYYEF